MDAGIPHRLIVVGLFWNRREELLICRMKDDRGVFPGQWGLPGGGVEAGERLHEALRREMREELGIEIEHIRPALFKDGTYHKTYPECRREPLYMIFLVFHCRASSEEIHLNEEFSDHCWVREETILRYDLNVETIDTFEMLGAWGELRD